jgi:hypothetical protein
VTVAVVAPLVPWWMGPQGPSPPPPGPSPVAIDLDLPPVYIIID